MTVEIVPNIFQTSLALPLKGKDAGVTLVVRWLKGKDAGVSLVVRWLGLSLTMQGVHVQSLVGELRSHMPHSQKTKT